MSIRPIEIAEHLGLSRQAINKFVNQGMPLDSIESAEAWYNSRRAARGADAFESSVVETETVDDSTFAEIVNKHRQLKALAYRQYEDDLAERSNQQAKSYATYDKLVKTLVALEREKQSRDIAAKKYIETQTAISIFSKILVTVRNELTQMGQRMATKANPDHPGTAMKAIEDEVNALLGRLSSMTEDAKDGLTNTDER
jgi:hypothetical protein